MQREILLYFTQRQSTKMTTLFVSLFTQNLKALKMLTRRAKLSPGSRGVVGIHLKGHFNNSCEILFTLKNVLRKAQGTLLHNIKLTNFTSNRGTFQLIFSLDAGYIKRFQEKWDQSVKTAYSTTHPQWLSLVPWLASKWGDEDEIIILADFIRPRVQLTYLGKDSWGHWRLCLSVCLSVCPWREGGLIEARPCPSTLLRSHNRHLQGWTFTCLTSFQK